MEMTRRSAIAMGAGALLIAGLPIRVSAAAEDAIAAFTGGAEVGAGDITLTAPEIAENGNPTPGVATFKFGKLAASRSASTRIRLAGTQDVVAIAKMEDGSFAQASSTVKVTIGGCGG